jgi:hypothetical protein
MIEAHEFLRSLDPGLVKVCLGMRGIGDFSLRFYQPLTLLSEE